LIKRINKIKMRLSIHKFMEKEIVENMSFINPSQIT